MLILSFGNRIKFPYLLIPLFLLFYIGGILQYTGLISLTQTNILVLLFLFPVFLYKKTWKLIRKEFLLILFIFYVIGVSNYYGSTYEKSLTYIYYILCTIIAAVSGRFYCERLIEKYGYDYIKKTYLKTIKIFLLIQVLICSLQNIFKGLALAYAPFNIIPEDIVSGTMYLQSDASLANISQLILISVFFLKTKITEKFIVSGLVLSIVLLGYSKAAQSVVLLIIFLLIAHESYKKFNLNKAGLKYLLYIFFLLLFLLWCYFYMEVLMKDFINHTIYLYQKRDSWVMAERLSPVGHFFYEELKLIGDGPLTYYNPNTKEWLYNAGFSTFYSLYLDLGLIGLLFYLAYYVKLIAGYTFNFFLSFIIFLVLTMYSQFNLTLSDIAFAFTLNFILVLFFNSKKHID